MDQAADTSTTARPRRAEAIFAATLELLATAGYEGLTMESVALRAGVNKTTLYRWWKSKDEVLAAALTGSDLLTFPVPDTGSLRGDLVETARSIHRLLTDAATAPIAAAVLAASPGRPSLAAIGRMFFADRAAREHPIFRRAVERGELDNGADPRLIMDMLAGAIWFRLFLRTEPVEAADIEAAVDMLLGGVAPQQHEASGGRP
ncbi:TetR/AcrR family transcriptional regulator [Nocardia sienata]|uniref:TetR/AcrR family transcriptional regulator n=1 Tax=Nocardia sienata TaxID=248552 RepID=UPI0007A4CBAA|nr:TetR/AcrR family transcriptional regulator [Nocardia sienata]